MFLTETAKLADVVLPAASFAEKEGTFTNFEGRANRVHKAIEPVGESLPDWEILVRLADKMDHSLALPTLQAVMGEIEELVPFYEGYADAGKRDGPAYEETGLSSGRPLLKGFARFSPVEYVPQVRGIESDYPFILLTGSILYHCGSGSRSSRAGRLKTFAPRSFVEICASDARQLGIRDGDEVRIASAVGEVTTTTKISDAVRRGIVFMPLSFPDTPVNALLDIVLDPETKAPSVKACSVKIERISPPEGGP
jgi:predicted molibdopterin-dependent oxidoreductase YjgC